MIKQFYENKINRLYLFLGGFFITNALIAEFIGVKIFSLEETLGFEPFNWDIFGVEGLGFNLTAGVVLWPVVFIMTDVINEYFGAKGVKLLSYMTVGLILYAFIMVYLAIGLAPNGWWQSESGLLTDGTGLADMDLAFRKIFGQGLWIIFGSLIAFLIGQIVDVVTFHKIKSFTGENRVWMRATGSTLVSQFIDSFVVLFIAFYIGANWSLGLVLAIGTVNFIYKFTIAVLLTPSLYVVHEIIDRYLGKELSEEMRNRAHGTT